MTRFLNCVGVSMFGLIGLSLSVAAPAHAQPLGNPIGKSVIESSQLPAMQSPNLQLPSVQLQSMQPELISSVPIAMSNPISDADAIRCLADDLQSDLRKSLDNSGVQRALIGSARHIETHARKIRNRLRSGTRCCDLAEEMQYLAQHVSELHALWDDAQYRVSRGLDGPMGSCAAPAQDKICQIQARWACLASNMH